MNILTFDIEDWSLEKDFFGNRIDMFQEFDKYMNLILETLDSENKKGTFFCLGQMAREYQGVIRKIVEHGHEVGCHSDKHMWLNKMSREECLEDTRRAVDSLEQVIGKKVKSYRAPAFSIGANNKWAFEVLAECGIERDASVFPAVRDFGGFAEFGQKTPAIIRYNGIELKEFPICTANIFGSEIAYSGGGYFRFFPLWYVKKEMENADYSMTYFHIIDLVQKLNPFMSKEEYEEYFKEPGTFSARCKRYIKDNLGRANAWRKLDNLMRTQEFVSLDQACSIIDWNHSPLIQL